MMVASLVLLSWIFKKLSSYLARRLRQAISQPVHPNSLTCPSDIVSEESLVPALAPWTRSDWVVFLNALDSLEPDDSTDSTVPSTTAPRVQVQQDEEEMWEMPSPGGKRTRVTKPKKRGSKSF